MADGESRFSPKLIVATVVVLVLVAIPLSTYLGGVEDTTPPSPAYEAMMAGKPLPAGYGLPAQRRGQATKGSSRLTADESNSGAPQNDADEGQQKKKKRRGNSKKKSSKQSKPDKHGVYRFDDGHVDHGKMPPPG